LTTKYESGRQVEQKVVLFLKKNGYSATRSAGSKGTFDVIGYNGSVVRFIQVKTSASEKTTYGKELAEMMACETPGSSSKEFWIHVKRKGFVQIWTTDESIEFPSGAIINGKAR
jgi:Holliday junction resolvase